MRDVHQLAVFVAQDAAETQEAGERGLRRREGHAFKIGGQGVNVAKLLLWPNQDVSSLLIQAAQGAQHVADVGAHAKIANAPDVYGDLHGESIDPKVSRLEVSQVSKFQGFKFQAVAPTCSPRKASC